MADVAQHPILAPVSIAPIVVPEGKGQEVKNDTPVQESHPLKEESVAPVETKTEEVKSEETPVRGYVCFVCGGQVDGMICCEGLAS